jgi:hypothetical protein
MTKPHSNALRCDADCRSGLGGSVWGSDSPSRSAQRVTLCVANVRNCSTVHASWWETGKRGIPTVATITADPNRSQARQAAADAEDC